MSLILCANDFQANAGNHSSPYTFSNSLSNTMTIPKNSEIAVQSVKINRSGNISINRATVFYLWFNNPLLPTLAIDRTTGNIKFAQPFFAPSDNSFIEVAPSDLANRLKIGVNNSIKNVESSLLNDVSTIVGADGFEGFKFTMSQTSACGVDISTGLTSTDFNLVYNEDLVAGTGFIYDNTTKRLTAIKSGGGNNKLYNTAVCYKPLSLIQGGMEISLTNANAASWSIGLVRSDPENDKYPDYFETSTGNEYWRNFDYYDVVLDAGQNGIGSGSNRYIKLFHAVKIATGYTMRELKYYEIVGNPFNTPTINTNGGYNWSSNTSGIDSIEYQILNEQIKIIAKNNASALSWTLYEYAAGNDKDQQLKPVNDCWRTMYGKFHLSAANAGKYLGITNYKGHSNFGYGNTNYDYWADLIFENLSLTTGFELDNRFFNDLTDIDKYAQLGVSASKTLTDYEFKLILEPSTLYIDSSQANTATLLGFPSQTVVSKTSTSGTSEIFDSTDIPPMKSNSSLFVRVPNLTHRTFNTSTNGISKILYHLPRFTNNGTSSGNALYFEPSEKTFISLNNPDDITINEFDIDFVNENETLAEDLAGKSIVMLYVREKK
tara:strand:- start:5685 stop:7499 length:1815 start_codon:yes stop_codon:yes gene_type:complete